MDVVSAGSNRRQDGGLRRPQSHRRHFEDRAKAKCENADPLLEPERASHLAFHTLGPAR